RVSKLVRTGTSSTPIYERTIYIDGIFEYVKLETGTTYEKNYIHIMDDKSRIAEVRINPGTAFPGDISDDITYVIENQIGSSVMRTNTSGTEIDKEEYYPFGDSSLRTFTYKRYRYVGKERDAESGLYYYGARYYAAWTCRFISVDPLAEHYMYLTPYNYANNNPINDFDIDGMQDTQSTTDSAKPYGPPTQQEMEQQKQNAKPGLPKVNGVTGPFSLSYIENTNSNQTSVTEAQKPDYSFSKEKINNLGNVYDEAKKTTGKQNPDCWEIYRQVASTLTGDKDVLKQSGQNMKLTNYMKDNNYFVNTQGQTFSYNSSRSGDANNGYKGNATSLIESNLNDQKDGSYVFALQVAFQHHNITIIAEKTGETYTYQAFDQGTGWFNETPEKMSAETLNKQVIKVYEHRFTEFGGQGKEISSRLYWYNGSTAK
ncbi:MAG: RHS repeat-associated core domain-containing protein, partial [Hyphomonadaceae bacterium]|nr:RHS repeat-associated core domain-containing protein [Hyphomonadaceae bacterium]